MTTLTTAQNLDDRLIDSAIGALEMLSIHIGRTLGLYEALTSPSTVDELATRTSIDSRYAREWLEQQAVAGFITVDDPSQTWDRRRYSLDDHQQAVLVSPDDPSHVSSLADMVAGAGHVLDRVVAAYRTGSGVAYSDYGAAFRHGQAGINRPAFTHDLATSWIAAVPDVAARLGSGGRVVDVGCGAGWSTIAMARAFPQATVIGIDVDAASIEDARRNAAGAGVAARFVHADGSTLLDHGPYDLVLFLEALHDMARPVDALRHARLALAANGAVLVADEKVAGEFIAPGDELERMMYGWSVVHCLPASMSERPSAAIGTVMRPDIVRALAADAGLSFAQSDIDAGFFRLYVLRP